MKTEIKYRLIFFASLIIGVWTFGRWQSTENIARNSSPATNTISKDSIVTVKLSAVGDLMCHSTQFNYARVRKDSFDFKPVFSLVKKYFAKSDLVMGNLETVVNAKGSNYSGYPSFNSPPEFLEAIKFAGFNHLFLSNNHILDWGITGLKETVKEIKKLKLSYSGINLGEDTALVKIVNVKGIRIGIIALTYLLNKHFNYRKNSVNILNEKDLLKGIRQSKKAGADLTLVYFHFGKEYEKTPTEKQKYFVKKAAAFGADIIVASHPHVVQPVEFIKSNKSRLDSVFVCYSMGNFLSNQRWRFSDGGVILNFVLKKNFTNNDIELSKVSYLPVWIFKGKINSKRSYLIYPESGKRNKFPNYFTKQNKAQCLQSFKDTDSLIHAFGVGILKDSL